MIGPRGRAADVLAKWRRPRLRSRRCSTRLSGDHNPLHADPEFARRVGFEKGPILHGALHAFGFMVRHVAKKLCAEATRLRIGAFEAQFRRPVWPGDTLVTRRMVGELQAPSPFA